MPNGAFNICCPRDAVSRTANVGTVGTNGEFDSNKDAVARNSDKKQHFRDT